MERGETAVVRPDSALALFDCDRPVSMTATCHDMSYLAFPRHFVAAAMCGAPAARDEAAVPPLGGGLEPMLGADPVAITVHGESGRASRRERVCRDEEITVGARSIKKKN